MELIYRPSESTVRPVEIEKTKHTVFLRRNIVEEERTDADGNVSTMWVYDEAKLSHEEFDKYASFMLVAGQANGDNNQMIIMEALADLYDAIANLM